MMGLKAKTFKEILNSMASWIATNNSKLTNFYVGSVIRTFLEAIAMELESLYFQMYKGFKYAIENAIYHSFNFYKYPAISASGTVTVTFREPLNQKFVIPTGYKFSTAPSSGNVIYFIATEDVTCFYNMESVDIPVQCTQPGIIGNVPAYTIRIPVQPMAIINEVYNTQAFMNGQAEESTDDRKKRFTRYIDTLSRGTVSAIQYGCLKVPGVTGVYVDDQVGAVKAYVHNADGDLPADLKTAVETSLVDYRAAGMGVEVLPVTKKPVDITITVTLNSGFDPAIYQPMVQSSVVSFLNYYPVDKDLMRAELIAYIMDIDNNAILNVVLSLTEDVVTNKSELIRAGVITVNIG